MIPRQLRTIFPVWSAVPGQKEKTEKVLSKEWSSSFEKLLLIAFISLASFPVLFRARAFDTNTLVSWRWVLPQEDFFLYYLAFLLLLAIPFVLLRYISLQTLSNPLLFTLTALMIRE